MRGIAIAFSTVPTGWLILAATAAVVFAVSTILWSRARRSGQPGSRPRQILDTIGAAAMLLTFVSLIFAFVHAESHRARMLDSLEEHYGVTFIAADLFSETVPAVPDAGDLHDVEYLVEGDGTLTRAAGAICRKGNQVYLVQKDHSGTMTEVDAAPAADHK
jgi:hypothetical protein